MSGLSPVPRIPKRASTMNGSEASSERGELDRQPPRERRAQTLGRPRSDQRRRRPRPARARSSAVVASPGSRTVHQASGQSAARPTAGASRDQRRRPQAIMIACPTSAAAPRMSRNEP